MDIVTAYHTTTDKAERKRLQVEVIEAYRSRVSGLVRKIVPSQFVEEGEQVGAIGLLVGLARYAPTDARRRDDRFWFFARDYVLNEVQAWMDEGVRWRPRSTPAAS